MERNKYLFSQYLIRIRMEIKWPSTASWFLLFVLIIAPILMIESGDGVYTGPFVRVEINETQMEPGKTTAVNVMIYRMDGGQEVPMDLIEVSVSSTHGSVSPESSLSDPTGYCYFTYRSPNSIQGPTTVTITALALTGGTNAQGTSEVQVTYKLQGTIFGPDLLMTSGQNVAYDVQVRAGGAPLPGANIMPTILGSATLVSFSQQTDADGKGNIVIHTSTTGTGSLTLMVQIRKEEYIASTVSKGITVRQDIGEITVSLSKDVQSVPSWGSCWVYAYVRLQGDPLTGVEVGWSANIGEMSVQASITDERGIAEALFIASANEDGPWIGNVVVRADVDHQGIGANATLNVPMQPLTVGWAADVSYRSTGTQLYAGESLMVRADIRMPIAGSYDLIGPANVVLVLYDRNMRALRTVKMAEDILIEANMHWTGQETQLMSVPSPAQPAEYYWDLKVVSRNGVHAYYGFQDKVRVEVFGAGGDDWTFMIYYASDNNLRSESFRSLDNLERSAPQGKFSLLAGRGGHERYVLHDVHTGPGVETTYEMNEGYTDSGSPETLLDFLLWGSSLSPAGHYCVIVWDHGAGVAGSAMSDVTMNRIENDEMRDCLDDFRTRRRKVDILAFDACLMSSLDTAYMFMDVADYLVGSGVVVKGDLFVPETLDILKARFPNNKPSARQVVEDMLEGYVRSGTGTSKPIYDYTALDLARARALFNNLDTFCQLMVEEWDGLGTYLDMASRRNGAPPFEYCGANLPSARSFFENLSMDLTAYYPAHRNMGAVILSIDIVYGIDQMTMRTVRGNRNRAVNLFFPLRPGLEEVYRIYYITGGLGAIVSYYTMGQYYLYGSPGGTGRPPLRRMPDGFTDTPLQRVEILSSESSLSDGTLSLMLMLDQTNNTSPVVVTADLSAMGDTRYPGMDELVDRKVLTVGGGEKREFIIPLTSPVNDTCEAVITVMSQEGMVLDMMPMGRYPLKMTERTGGPPTLSIGTAPSQVMEGQLVEFVSHAEDPDGDELSVWWDLDHRDGLGLDRIGDTASKRYFGEGEVIVTCIASDGEHTVISQLNLSIIKDVHNKPPIGRIDFSILPTGLVVFDASASYDPDGDDLEFLFDFGDNNLSGWTDSRLMVHDYGLKRIYTCSLLVRDGRGGVSQLSFANIPVSLGRIEDFHPSFIVKVSGSVLGIDLEGSYNTSLAPVFFTIYWGDGNVTMGGENETSFSHEYRSSGSYGLNITMKDRYGRLAYHNEEVDVEDHGEGDDMLVIVATIAVICLIVAAFIISIVIIVSLFLLLRRRNIEE